MKRHLWVPWRKAIERCSRPGCNALRDRTNYHAGPPPPNYSLDGGKTWSSARPACTGQPTTDEGAS